MVYSVHTGQTKPDAYKLIFIWGIFYKIKWKFFLINSLNSHLIEIFIKGELNSASKWPKSFPDPPNEDNLFPMNYQGMMRNIHPWAKWPGRTACTFTIHYPLSSFILLLLSFHPPVISVTILLNWSQNNQNACVFYINQYLKLSIPNFLLPFPK